MFKTAISTACAVALAVATSVIIPVTPAAAQVAGVYTCVAQSPYATGRGVSYDGDAACRRALYECSIRTPSYSTCYVTRWWYS